jgi:hypothetical protein
MNPFDYERGQAVEVEQSVATSPLSPGSKAGRGAEVKGPTYELVPADFVPDLTVKCLPENDENAIIRFFVARKVYGYPCTTGTIMSNYYAYCLNNHPFISMLFCHRLNPFNVKQRAIVFFCVSTLALLLTYIALATDIFIDLAMCRGGCTLSTSESNCVGGVNDGVPIQRYAERCAFYSNTAVSASIGLVLLPYASLLRFLSTCGCLKGRGEGLANAKGFLWCSGIVNYLGGGVMTFFVSISFFFALFVIVEVYRRGGSFSIIVNFFLSKVVHSSAWFVWVIVPFACRYEADKQSFYWALEMQRIATNPRTVVWNAQSGKTFIRQPVSEPP